MTKFLDYLAAQASRAAGVFLTTAVSVVVGGGIAHNQEAVAIGEAGFGSLDLYVTAGIAGFTAALTLVIFPAVTTIGDKLKSRKVPTL